MTHQNSYHKNTTGGTDKLQFISSCVRTGRLFVSQLLKEMKGMTRGKWYRVSDEIRRDIK